MASVKELSIHTIFFKYNLSLNLNLLLMLYNNVIDIWYRIY